MRMLLIDSECKFRIKQADRIKADYDMIANKNFCTYEMKTGDPQKE